MAHLKVASIGLGWFGEQLATSLIGAGAGEVITGYARHPESRERFCRSFGAAPAASLEEIWARSDVEAVLVATPHSTHLPLIEAAAAAGKHVFVEKPMTLTAAEARRAISAAERAGVVLQVGHNKRRQPATRRLKAMVESGELGQVHLLTAITTLPKDQVPRPGWRSDPAECPVGGMTALGIHLVDSCQYLVGPVSRVQVMTKHLWGAGPLDDVTVVGMEFASGPLGELTTSVVLPRHTSLMVMGTSGAAWNRDDGEQLLTQRLADAAPTAHEVAVLDTVRDELVEFAACVRGERQPETGGAVGLRIAAVLDAVRESALTGAVVAVAAD